MTVIVDSEQVDQLVFKELVDVRFPMLSAHLEGHGVNVSSVSTNWFLCIFVNSLPLESCLRVWDIFFLECCSSVLFRVALALVDIYFKVLHPGALRNLSPLRPLPVVHCSLLCWLLVCIVGALLPAPSAYRNCTVLFSTISKQSVMFQKQRLRLWKREQKLTYDAHLLGCDCQCGEAHMCAVAVPKCGRHQQSEEMHASA